MRLIDLSQPLDEHSPGNPNHPRPQKANILEWEKDRWLTEIVTFSVHSGTHIDAPSHKLRHWKGISDFDLEVFCGKAVVADFRDLRPRQMIQVEDLQKRLPRYLRDRIVLLATGWGEKRMDRKSWNEDIPFISPDGAQWLVDKRIRAIGIDHWSIGGPREPTHSLCHSLFMADNIWIIENMLFPEMVFSLPNPMEFWCLPVNMPNVTGALCRPVVAVRGR